MNIQEILQEINIKLDCHTRIEKKVDDLSEKLDSYSTECTRERGEFSEKIAALEKVNEGRKELSKETRSRIWAILEKCIIWAAGIYLLGKDAFLQKIFGG